MRERAAPDIHSMGPGWEATEGHRLGDGRSGSHLLLQVWVLKLQEVEQVTEKVIEDICLIHLPQGIPVDSSRWEFETQPLGHTQ